MPSFDWIIKEVESGIKALIEKFIQMPYFFYSEQDMQSYLYHKLISGRLGKHLVQNYFRDKSILLHREYPTLRKYSGTVRSKRGHFDLAILYTNKVCVCGLTSGVNLFQKGLKYLFKVNHHLEIDYLKINSY